MSRRLKFIQFFLFSLGALITARLIYWQIIKQSDLAKQASLQHTANVEIPAPRGEIKSSDGFALATNIDHFLLYVNPHDLPSNPNLYERIASLLPASDSARQSLSQLKDSRLFWFPLAHNLPFSIKSQLDSLNISGIGFEPEPGRTYPEGSASAHLLGFVGQDSQGLPQGYFGLEGFYNRELTGKSGLLIQERDAFNRPIVIGKTDKLQSQWGRSLTTSIDRTVQFIISAALQEGLTKYQASSGTISVMDPTTGKILGMVASPSYDPGQFQKYPPENYKNPIISDAYEPGSTFKVLVMAASLDAGVVTPDTRCEICTGPAVIGDAAVRSWDNKYFPGSSMTDVILHSDNVGMVFVSRKLGKDRMLDYLRRFGIGQETGIDLQEESTPLLRPNKDWRDIDWATTAFGQGIAVTPIQMLRAVGAIANLGKLVTPHVVTQITSPVSTKTNSLPPPVQVISPQAAALVTQMMINGVNRGEVRYYKPDGYLIAGKTGTAQVPIAGHYDPNKVIASFIGFAPADHPRFVMLVTLKDPHPSPWGSTTAAPMWFGIAQKLFRYYNIPPYN